MPGEGDREKFKRDVVEGSELNYVQKMIHFYSSMLDDLSRKIGEETEYGVPGSLSMIEERLSDFEEREKKLIENYRKFARKVKGIKI